MDCHAVLRLLAIIIQLSTTVTASGREAIQKDHLPGCAGTPPQEDNMNPVL